MYHRSSKDVWEFASFALVPTDVVRPDCATTGDFTLNFVMKMIVPLFVAVMFILCFFTGKLIVPQSMDKDRAINAYGAVYKTFFIAIARNVLSILNCYQHPNKKYSLLDAPQVFCNTDLWVVNLVIAIIGALIFCVGAIALYSWAVYKAPTSFKLKSFRQRFKFLFATFRPDCFWWSIVIPFVELALNFVMVFDDKYAKLIWLGSVYMLYFCLTVTVLPWRLMAMSVLDCTLTFFIAFQFTIVSFFNPLADEYVGRVAQFILVFGFIPFGIAFLFIVQQIYYMKKPPTPKYIETSSLTWQVVRGVDDQERLTLAVQTYNEYDIMTISSAMTLLIQTGCVNADLSMHIKSDKSMSLRTGSQPRVSSADAKNEIRKSRDEPQVAVVDNAKESPVIEWI